MYGARLSTASEYATKLCYITYKNICILQTFVLTLRCQKTKENIEIQSGERIGYFNVPNLRFHDRVGSSPAALRKECMEKLVASPCSGVFRAAPFLTFPLTIYSQWRFAELLRIERKICNFEVTGSSPVYSVKADSSSFFLILCTFSLTNLYANSEE